MADGRCVAGRRTAGPSPAGPANRLSQPGIPTGRILAGRPDATIRSAVALHGTDGAVVAGQVQNLVTALVNADSTIGRRLREFRVISAEIHGFTRVCGREPELGQLHAAFDRQPREPTVRVLTGMGGVGKTSIARAYAAKHHHQYTLIWWIRAQHADAIPDQFRALLALLAPDDAARVPDPISAVHAVLANRTGRWLLVLDNLPDPAAGRGLIPAAGPGDVVITTQTRTWPNHDTIPIGCLSTEEGTALLAQLSGDPDTTAAEALAEELAGLPLALALAGTYVATNPGTTLADYHRLYQCHRPQLDRDGQLPDYELTVTTTWQVAFDTLDAPARALLNLLCWLAPEAIPLHLILTSSPPGSLPEPVARELEPVLCNELARNRAISALAAVSLTTPASPSGAVNIHRLVQAVTRDQSHVTPDPWANAAGLLVNNAIPEPTATVATLAQWNLLHTHLRTVLHHLPADHPDTLTTRANLARWTAEAGDSAAARDQFAALLPDRIRVLGPDHPHTLVTRNNLAYWTGEAGDSAAARDQFAALLPDALRIFGPDHTDSVIARGNLARWTGEAGDSAAARDQFAALLPDALRIFGPDHPHTLTTRSNLARWTGEAGDSAAARDQFAALLSDRTRVLGPDHPQTLNTRSNLANWTGEAGDSAAARDQFAALLSDQVRVLGPDHPQTLNTRHNSAYWTGAGDADATRAEFAALLLDAIRILGSDHPHTLVTRNNLAYWTGRAGDAAAARDQCAALLPDRIRVLGPDHPHTHITRHDFARWTGEAGDAAAARDQFAALLPDRIRVLGADHPHTVKTRDSLSYWSRQAGESPG